MSLDVLDGIGVQRNMSTTTDASGNLVGSTCITDPSGSGAKAAVATPADASALAGNGVQIANVPMLFNGTTYDRERGNIDAQSSVVSLGGVGAGTYNSGDTVNHNHRGIQVGINITAITGTSPTLTVTIQGKDVASGQYYTLLASAALNATGFTLLTIYPGLTVAANSVANQVMPRTFNIKAVVGGTTPSVTATIGTSLVG